MKGTPLTPLSPEKSFFSEERLRKYFLYIAILIFSGGVCAALTHFFKGENMNIKKKILAVFFIAMLMASLSVIGAFAEDASGYTFDSDGKTYTNIKWTFTEADKTVVFEIDASATDKKASTVIYGKDPVTGKPGAYATPIQNGWGQLSGVTKAVIKDGITKIDGGLFALNRTINAVEIPASLKEISNGPVFEGCSALATIYIAGNAPVSGTFDISCVEALKNNGYMFDGCRQMKALKFSSVLSDELGTEFIKNASNLTELEIPAGVTRLGAKSLSLTNGLKTLTILGMNTELAGDNVFNGNTGYPAIKAKAGSKAEEFAKANGYTFINIETGEETKGTKPAPSVSANSGGTTGGSTTSGGTTSGSTSFPIGLDAFDPNEATAYGLVSGQYYNTYWVYYQETKTLKFFTNTASGWNETGRIDKCEDKIGWSEYKQEIEYIEIGPQMAKVTGQAFKDHTALKEVKLGRNISQIDVDAFSGCTSLTTVWYDGGERVEGRIDLTKVKKVNSIITGTAVKEVLLGEGATMNGTLGFSLQQILSPSINDDLINYVKENGYKLVNAKNPEEVYDYYIEMPEGIVPCGDRCGFKFDEATGTLTIYGSGAMKDIVNYYGGGSKTSPWFDIKKQIKHVVISEHITAIGKYNFTQCANLETVQLPNSESFIIENAAFEKCTNLKSIYRTGTEPIVGTFDLSNVHEINAWTFAYDYLVANVIVSDQVTEIGTSVFEENTNLANIYGVPGSYAEIYATENGFTFFDISSNVPQPIECELPESSEVETTTATPESTSAPAESVTTTEPITSEVDTTNPLFAFEGEDVVADAGGDSAENIMLPIIITAAVAIVVAVVVIFVKKKKK